MHRRVLIVTALLLPLTLSACTATTGPTFGSPTFDGPWAAEFKTEYANATSDYERAVLADGDVSEQEYAETVTRYTECLSSVGISVDELLPNGQMSYTFTGDSAEDSVAAEDECSVKSGYGSIGMLYSWVYVNPQKLDVAEITSACLIRSGSVSAGYGADDYLREAPTGVLSFIVDPPTGAEALRQCSSAPLTAFTE